MRRTTLSLMIGTLLLSGAAVAGGQDKQGAEAKGKAESRASLSLGSVRTMGSATAFAKVDADGDRMITRSEADAMQGLPRQFGKLDANGDGQLTAQEFAALTVNASSQRGRSPEVAVDAGSGIGVDARTDTGKPGDGRPGARMEAESAATADLKVEDINRANAVQAFNDVDADGDFKLDQEEAARIEGLDEQFAELDRDGDGALDYAEFNAITSVEYRD